MSGPGHRSGEWPAQDTCRSASGAHHTAMESVAMAGRSAHGTGKRPILLARDVRVGGWPRLRDGALSRPDGCGTYQRPLYAFPTGHHRWWGGGFGRLMRTSRSRYSLHRNLISSHSMIWIRPWRSVNAWPSLVTHEVVTIQPESGLQLLGAFWRACEMARWRWIRLSAGVRCEGGRVVAVLRGCGCGREPGAVGE